MWQQCKDLQQHLINLRRDLHQIPELDTQLPQTTAYVRRELDRLGIPYRQNQQDTGLVALIQGGPGKVVALRADMDALPIREETGVDYASQNGCMHACGHDSHTAMLLGAAQVLQQNRSALHGAVKLLFQTGEETAHGAALMVEEGALENPKVDALVGLHIGSIVPQVGLGQAAVVPGNIMASYDRFVITIRGKGCHGSTPEKGVDPIAVSSVVVGALQQIVSREVSAAKPAVVTIGKITGGFAYNIIPDEVVLEGTIRATQQEVREQLSHRIQEISQGISSAMNASARYEIFWGAPPVVNDPAVTQVVQQAAQEVLGTEQVLCSLAAPNMGGEDVAHYLQKVPGCFFFLGSSNPEKHTDYPHHNCKFNIDEDVLWKGSAVLVRAAQLLLG